MAEINLRDINLRIGGMHCEACVRRVTQALQAVPGTQVESVRVGGAHVRSESDSTTPQALIAAIEKAGFTAFPEQ